MIKVSRPFQGGRVEGDYYFWKNWISSISSSFIILVPDYLPLSPIYTTLYPYVHYCDIPPLPFRLGLQPHRPKQPLKL